MTLTAIILVVISAFMHAGWNLLSKSKRPSAAFFLVASIAGAVFLSPVLIVYHDTLVHSIPVQVWILLLMAGFFMALYCISLAGAYRSGDMSIAYPLARSSPVIVVSVVGLIMGRSDQLTIQCVVGIILVVGGCFMVPLQRFRDLHFRNYLNVVCGLSILAAVGTSGYSILDDEALRLLRNTPEISLNITEVSLLYACLEAMATTLWLAIFIAARRKERSRLRQVLHANKGHAILAGLTIHVAYLMVLASLALVKNVSYVVAFRQLSVLLGTAFAILVLKEAPHKPKLVGVTAMFTGLVMVATG